MFTGIIEELGEVVAWQRDDDAGRLTVRAPLAVSDAEHGDSISVSGVCLTVVEQGPDWFTADVMGVTIDMSTLGSAQPGRRVNIERAAQLHDRLGGHIVQGHIDGTARVLSVADEGAWRVLRFSLDAEHAPLVVR
ncbi:MAG TPA: riboflavin synthase, partial [Rhodoglobus sp.]|nr:riboflavin synthase [Rhodoglobus sp.]